MRFAMTTAAALLASAPLLAGCACRGGIVQTMPPAEPAPAMSPMQPEPAKHAGLPGEPRPLDGATFNVTLKPQGQEPMADKLTFTDGTFESTSCIAAGFKKAPYSTKVVSGGATQFTVECDSPTMGHNVWHGVVTGNHVEGTLVRTPKGGGVPVMGTFTGERER